ncbi:LysR family transcriptional regulator [Undibacterium sp.]|jgi:LysR family transcriptional regulator for bpeEF and oprC|uniref:LysR family transcriptional regulator n=1 Tax=Undibacterium sp. TaxID=1914977 RepID=UPI002BB5C8FE|nr:LysR family transcriptional regulator [Undibacterium sp.]HTD05711.1 LysR family transcriptional regulator [Undibacterium sp.]
MDRLEALNVFCRVVEFGGFSKAADKLGVSTSSVTNHIAGLEKHFNAKLLNRTTRSMSLTDEGRQCYEHALQLLSDMSELEGSLMQSNRKPGGSLRVDMPSIISRLYVAPALPRFLAAYPDITLKMTVGDRNIDMVEEGVDVLIRIGNLPSSNLIAKSICKTEYICCASPAFLEKHGVPASPEDLAQYPCLSFLKPNSRQVRPWLFERGGEKFQHIPQALVAMDHVESMIEAAKAGAGIVQHMSISVAEPIRAGSLVPILRDWMAPGPDVAVLFQQKHHRAAKIKAFVDFVEGLFKP